MTDRAKPKGLPGRPLSPATPLATLLPIIGAGNSNRIYRAEEAPASAETQTAPLLTQPLAQPAALFSQFMPIIPPLSPSPDNPDNPDVDPPSPELPAAVGVVLPAAATGLLHALAGPPPAPLSQSQPHLSELHRHLPEPLVLRALASEPQQRLYEVAFQTGPDLLDLNQDAVITSQDAQVLYYFALFQASTIDQATLTTLLNNLGGPPLTNERLTELMALNLLNPVAAEADFGALDLNRDGSIDLQDVQILYYAYRFGDILRASPSLREAVLSGLTVQDDVADADRQQVYLAILDQVAGLVPPVPTGDHAFRMDEGTSYTLSPDDLSARDPDDAGAALIWTLTTAPTHGRLELQVEGSPPMAITEGMTFTQAQLAAGEVVYVHTGADASNDSFDVQVANLADPDGAVPAGAVTLTVEVFDSTNLSPTEVTLTPTTTTLAEDTVARTQVAEIAVTDSDGGPRRLELVGDDRLLFELSSDQTALFLGAGQVLDFETRPTLAVTVQVIGSSSAEQNAPLSITVTDANDAPTTGGGLAFTVDEGASHMLTPTELSAMDEDEEDTPAALIWTLTDAPDNGRLELRPTTGPAMMITEGMTFTQAQLAAGEVFYVHDDSNTPSDGFTVRLADDGGLPAAAPVTLDVTVTPMDDGPTEVVLSNPVSSLDENTVARTQVADIVVVDADDGPAATLELAGAHAGLFELGTDTETGERALFLRADAALDHETTPSLEVIVRVVGTPEVAATLNLPVGDVNEAPTTSGGLAFRVIEGASYVLTPTDLSATDEDETDGPAELTWTVTDAPDSGRLAFIGTPESAITSFTQADVDAGRVVYIHTGADTTPDSFMVRVADDDGTMVGPVTLDVTVDSTTNELPTAVMLTNPVTTLREDADTSSPMRVADIALSDTDGNDTLVLTGEDANLFELNGAQTQLLLRAGAVLDFETNPSLDVTVRAVRNPAGVNAALRIPVTDQNDAPTTSGGLTFTVAEGASYMLTPTDLLAMDEDGSDGPDMLTWMVTTAPTNGQLELTTGPGTSISTFTQADVDAGRVLYVHDGGETTEDGFTVQVEDDGGLPAATPVTLDVTVTPMNDAPTTGGDLAFTVIEGASYVLMTPDLSATDDDESDGPAELTWTVTDAPDSGRLAFLGTSEDAITSFTQADVDAGRVVYIHTGTDTTPDSFTVRVMDDDGEMAAPVTLTVAVVNTPTNMLPTAVTLTNPVTTLREDADTSNPMRVADIGVTDNEGGEMLVLTGDDAGLFEFNEDQTQLLLSADAALDFETNPFLDVTVRAVRDPAGVNAALRIPVSDQNDAPTTSGGLAFTVTEGASHTLMTTDLSAMDEDGSDGPAQLTWRVVAGNGPANGQLELMSDRGTPINEFTQDDVNMGRVFYVHNGGETTMDSFTVEVMDDGGLPAAAPVTLDVTVTPMNDAPTTTGSRTFTVDEGAGHRLTTTELSAMDEDDDVATLIWTLTDAPENGRLELRPVGGGSDVPITQGMTFTQAQLAAGEVFYVHDGMEEPTDGFTVQVMDDDGEPADAVTLDVTVTPMDDTPTGVALIRTVDSLDENADTSARTKVADIMVTDADSSSLADLELAGTHMDLFELGTDPGPSMFALFLRAGANLDHETTSPLEVTVQVVGDAAVNATFSLPVNDVNEAPTTTTRIDPFTVVEGTSYMLTTTDLSATDEDDSDGPAELTWRVMTAPMNGQLELTGTAGTAISTFTQAQLEAGEVFYVHGGEENLSDRFTLQVRDDEGTPADAVTLAVTVTPMNDAPTAVTLTRTVNSLDEDTTARTKVADIVLTDEDGGSVADLELTGTHERLFELGTDSITGNLELFLRAGANLDHETTSSLEVTVQVVRNVTVNATLSFPVNDVNEAPTTTTDGAFTVDEGDRYMLTTTDLSATDEDDTDGPGMLTWTVMTGPMNGRLELTGSPGTSISIFTQAQLEAGEVFYVHGGTETTMDRFTVRVMDDGGAQAAPVTLDVTVTPMNDAPTTTGSRTFTVDEGAGHRLTTTELSAMDEDDDVATLIWTLTDAPENGRLELRPVGGGSDVPITQGMTFTQAQLAAGEVFYVHDGMEEPTDGFTVQVMDDDGEPADAVTLDVTVTPMDDTPTGVALIRTVDSLDENADTSARTKVADIMVTDADSSSLADLELAGTHMDLFELGTDPGPSMFALFLRAGAPLNHETTSSLEVTVQVVGDAAVNATLSFPVNDVNEAPTTTTDGAFTVDEGDRYMLTTTDLSATDEDDTDGPGMLTWTVMTGPMNGRLELTGSPGTSISIFTQAQLEAGEVFYVHGGEENLSDSFTVGVMDDEDTPAVAPVTLDVTVTPMNDAPTTTGSRTFTVDEGAGHRLTTTELSAMDEDDDVATLIWTLTDAPENGRLELRVGVSPAMTITEGMTFTQAQLAAGEVFYVHGGEENLSDSFTVRVMDDEGTPAAAPVTLDVTVTPINDAPTAVTLTRTVDSLDENADTSARTKVADIMVTDDDSSSLAELELAGTHMDLFELGTDPGPSMFALFLRAGAPLNHETTSSLEVTVQVVGDAAVNATFSLPVNDVNEAPTTTIRIDPFTVDEGGRYMLTTTDLSATDEDDGPGMLTWTVMTGPTNGRLELTGTAGMSISIFTQAQLAAGEVFYVHGGEENLSDSFTVGVMDDEGTPAVAPVTLDVTVTPVNDAPTTTGDLAIELNEGASYALTMGDLSATDVDDDADVLIWTLTDAPENGRLELGGGARPSVMIMPGGTFTQADVVAGRVVYIHTGTTSDSFTVRVMDDDGEMADPDMLDVTVNAAPTTTGSGIFTVDEGASHMLMTTELSAMDEDDDAAALTWTLTDAPENGRLELRPGGGSPIMTIAMDGTFTQAQLAAGEVFYLHDDSNTPSDGFTVRVADDGGARAAPVTLNIDITRILDNIDLTELAPEDGFIIQGDADRDFAGRSVSGAGDVNGDGYADLIVGAHQGDDADTIAGEAYVVFGADVFENIDLTSLAEEDGFIIQGDMMGDSAGIGVSGAGDVNGDGFADLIIGASGGDDGADGAGEIYVVFGKTSGFGSPDPDTNRRVIDLTRLAAEDGFIIQNNVFFEGAGRSVSGAGDVNGDGYADLLFGIQRANSNAGETYVVFGKAGGFGSPDPDTNRRVIDLATFSEADGFTIQGGSNLDFSGYSVSGAGDVNGDGIADLIVGAHGGGTRGAGEAYVVFGKATGFDNIDLSTLRTGDGFIIRGGAGDRAGRSVSGAGDVNGDGIADLIVGANEGNDGGTNAGEAYVVFGKTGGFDNIDLNSLDAEDGFIIQGDMAGDEVGWSVSGAGDVNGDGFADLIVGARNGDDGGYNAGEAYVVFGKEGGFGNLDPDTNRRVVDLTGLAPEDGFIIQGDVERDQAGRSVSGAGDVNGDGFADLIVGAYRGDDGGTYAGEAYVLFGGPAGLSTEAAAVLGTDGEDDLNADGAATVVLAGAGDDVLNIDGFGDTDLLSFDGGTGTDTLRLNGAGLSLDLSTLPDTRLSSIERIDLSGSGANSLTLTRLDLLNLSEVRTQEGGTEGRAELRVDGNLGDGVNANDVGWMFGGEEEREGTMYRVFDNNNARLLININVALGTNLDATGMATLGEVFQNYYAMTQTVDVRALIDALPPEDEEQQRKRMEDELAMLGPLPAARAALEAEQPTAVAEPDTDLFDLPILNPDDGM